jgi:hypothetical protein
MGQSPARLNVGVGSARTIEKLTIRWPTGKLQDFHNLPVDCDIVIVEGTEKFELVRLDAEN